jgi:predicted ATP-grasp superfamily ATP-dependent carboligase
MTSNHITVFVTDGNERPALAITRSLGRRGATVLVGSETAASLASASRYCARHVTYPSPSKSPEAFARFVLEFVAREQIDVVVPVTDVATHLVASLRHVLAPHVAVTAPSLDAFEHVSNKSALMQRAALCGIPIPRTLFVDGAAGLEAVIDRVAYPAVVKPARSRMRVDNRWIATSVQYARCASDLRQLYRTTEHLATQRSLIQERIVGPGMGIFVLCDRGSVRASFAHRRLREKPPSGGVSVLCQSMPVDPALVDQAAVLLGPLRWHGVAMLEYKQDRNSGTLFLMEVNGRFWGSLQLAVDAGVDFPHLCCQLALQRPFDSPSDYTIGLRSRWLLGDFDHLFLRLCHPPRDLPADAPSKLRSLIEFSKPWRRRLRHEIFRRDDARPAWHELREYVKALHLFDSRRRPVRASAPLVRMSHAHKGETDAGLLT